MNGSDVIQRLIGKYKAGAAALSRREDVKNISAAWKALWRQSEELLRQIIAYDNPCWVSSDNLHKALEAFLMNAEILTLDAPVSEQERQFFGSNLPLLRHMKAFCRSEHERVRAEADWWIKNYIFDPDDEDYQEQLERWDIFAGISDTYA